MDYLKTTDLYLPPYDPIPKKRAYDMKKVVSDISDTSGISVPYTS